MTYQELQDKIKDLEDKKQLNDHLNPVDYDMVIPVDENYPYIKKGFKLRLIIILQTLFIIWPYQFYLNKIKFRTKVIGKKNVKHLKQAIFTCNHVDIFDCLVVKRTLRPRIIKSIAAPFNNRKGKLGSFMRSGGMLPLSETYAGMKKFNEAITYHVGKGKSILIYPEQSMWWHYRKFRPHLIGAYHFAVKYNLPIVPLLITFKETKKLDKNGYPKERFTLHIMEPIYAKENLNHKEQAQYLMDTCMEKYKAKYEEVYNAR